MIQDVTTRWWSTWQMCARLLQLRKAVTAMAALNVTMPNSKVTNLTDFQWTVIELAERLLKPFMETQKMLEGESYVTVSYIPFMLSRLRKGLEAAATEQQQLLTLSSRGARLDISSEAKEAADAADAALAMLALAVGMSMEAGDTEEDDAVNAALADTSADITLPSLDPAVLREAELAIRETASLMLTSFNDRFGSGAKASYNRRLLC